MAHNNFISLSNHFLVATPAIDDPFFGGSVVYLCDHTEKGAMGVVINKPSPIRMEQLFQAVEKPTPERFAEKWVLLGGPVQTDRGFLVHTPVGNWENSILISDQIAMTTSRDILIDGLSKENNSIKTIATIGCSGWTAGQLEEELNQNHWLITPQDNKILFDLPYYCRYEAALRQLKIRVEQISSSIGHA